MGIIEKAANRLGQSAPHETDRKRAPNAVPVPEAGARSDLPQNESAVLAKQRLTNPPAQPAQEWERPADPAPAQRPMAAPPAISVAASPASSPTSKRVEIDLSKLNERGLVTPDAGRSPVAEEFRAIKRTLLDRIASESGKSKRSNLIMVTSSMPSEGKTFCSINLAMSIALEMDHTVLLVDADVARPSVLRTLGLESDAGLMDILLDPKVRVPDVMLKTNVNTLSILPAGCPHRHATELLASQAMSRLLDEIASRYADRIVIFDSPPLLLTTEARALATQMGQIVMVVEAESTTQRTLKNALRQIEACPHINLVYNKSKAFGSENYAYYSYYK